VRVVVTGGAGFLGYHLCERLLREGHDVVCVDNFLTGRREHVEDLTRHSGFTSLEHNVSQALFLEGPIDVIYHLACPASPVDYLRHPIPTLKVGALGTWNTLGLAKAKGSRYLLASTSEVYGDPQVHPQPESYWGHVNPVGPRGVYDEAKRFAEAMTMAYHRFHGVDTCIARIHNTYGPFMRPDDGRAVPTFITQSLKDEPMTVHGDGSQTRSLCYVDDMIDGLARLSASNEHDPVNLGNPDEMTVLRIAELVRELTGARSEIVFLPRPVDDPAIRQPDITRARTLLGWEPAVPIRDGLERTIAWFREHLG
jgi:dTDP-glucose 4,6-dehydratase